MKKLVALLMALVMVFALAACGAEEAPAATEAPAANNEPAATEAPAVSADADPLKIVYCGYTTSHEYGDRFQQLAKIVEEKINAEGGVNGAPIEFVVIDGGDNDQQEYIDAMLKALEEDGVDAIIGTFFSQYALACADYVTEAQIPVFNIATNFEMAEACDYYYTNRCVDTAFSNVMAQVAIDNGVKNPINVVYNTSNGYNDSKFMTAYMENAGFSSAGEIAFDNVNTTDYTPIVLQAINSEADGILLHATAGTDGQSIIQLLRQYDYQYPIISNSNLFSASFIQNCGPEYCVGLIGFAEYADTLERPEIDAFRAMTAESDAFSYDTVSWIDASMYDDICLIVEAAKLAGSNTKEGVIEGLAQIEGYKGVMTDYSYHDDHSFADYIYLAEIDENSEVVVSEALKVTH